MRTRETEESIEITIRLRVPRGTAMMECEEEIQQALNQAGRQATTEFLKRFDSDGSAITVAGMKLTSKGLVAKNYQTPYGEVPVERHVYQSSEGGTTFCPLDQGARIINSTTPKFARMCSYKYTAMNSILAQKDLLENHGRSVSRCYLQDIEHDVGLIAQDKQEHWTYADPEMQAVPDTVSVGVDGTCMLCCEEGWRLAMVGTISLYDYAGERLHTTYLASPPEYGKESFLEQMEQEMARCKERYPWAHWVGVADGARDHWPWLEQWTDDQVLDFYHAAGYLSGAAAGMHRVKTQREEWRVTSLHRLKHEPKGAEHLLEEMKRAMTERDPKGKALKGLEKAVGYFENNLHRMDYAHYRKKCLPIGSGVTEAACKTVIKQRMCGSGMKWKHSGASTVIRLRCLLLSDGRWGQFWSHISRYGF